LAVHARGRVLGQLSTLSPETRILRPETQTAGILSNTVCYDQPMNDPMPAIKLRIAQWAASRDVVSRVWLFGSRVRGTRRNGSELLPTSDLDVAVELTIDDEDEALGYWMFEEEKWTKQLQARLPWPLDLQWYHRTGTPHICQYVADCSVQIYPLPPSAPSD
jgi:predicted nucleotidyltransferase